VPDAVLEIVHLQKSYGALRPLRISGLRVAPGAAVALLGLDAPAAEIFVNLVTGATLPDAGDVRVFGRNTRGITEGDEWLRTLDRFGILSDRAVLLEELTVAQNLAMTFTLEVDPVPPAVRTRVTALAAEVGLPPAVLDGKVATIDAAARLRVRLGRAIALEPDLLLMEHPTATLAPADVAPFAGDAGRLATARTLAVVAVTADAAFASAIAPDVLKLRPADGELMRQGSGWTAVRRLFDRS
jgi:ABC-type transporter Mla maintaining outer membrane lipid asymmetry ATPase subunit MlaF